MTISPPPSNLHYEFTRPQQHDQEANVRFTGCFEGKTVCWQARIMTLDFFKQEYQPDTPLQENARQFIEIQPGNLPEVFQLTVTLAVERIDHPTILKTMIMVRNYKRLARGRHVYGASTLQG